MNRRQLEHTIVEIGEGLGLDYFYIVSSAAILASVPELRDADLTATRDIDMIPNPSNPDDINRLANQVDVDLGEGSLFDLENGVYVQGLDRRSPTCAPSGWKDRAVWVAARNTTALCMEKHDLAISKYGAGREQDLTFTAALARHALVQESTLMSRAKELDMSDDRVERICTLIKQDFQQGA